MSLLTKKKYSFESKGMDKETFTVVSFRGFDAISKPYKFEILLVSEKTNVDPLKVLQNPALFTIHRDEEDDVKFNGILMQFEETQEFDGHLFFKAVLTPKLWWLSLTHHNQVFLDLSVPEIIEHTLKDGGLNYGIDFSFNLMNDYQSLEYVCQYDESHFNFASRWAEREGIYYFFEQTKNGEKIIFTDSKMEHKDLLLGKDLIYLPQSGLDTLHTKEVIQSFLCRHNMLPQKVFLKDYNYLKPSLPIEGMADVDKDGRGENYIYGVNFDSPEEGNRLAKIRAEALICRKSIFHGESSVPFIIPGYTFDLNDHYKDVYNRKYLVTEVTHEGHQTGYLISGLNKVLDKRDEAMFYSNTFTAIYSDEQFRAEHLSEKPKISGTINAKIDASGSGEYAELDEYGRYKVILPFDRSGRSGGKASASFRMMQPSAGQNQGIHFPLHKGTEVLLTFIDGNPDRPLIAGAIPNPETSSPVTYNNQTKSIIVTASDNYIELEDDNESERIRTHSGGNLWQEAQDRFVEYTTGVPSKSDVRPADISDLIDKMYDFKSSSAFAPTGVQLYKDDEPYRNPTGEGAQFTDQANDADKWQYLVDRGQVTIAKGDTFNTQEGNIYDFGGYWNYNLGNSYSETFIDQSPQLNALHEFDLLDKGGPNWEGWRTIYEDEHDGSKNEIKDTWDEGTWTPGNVWVEKTFGDTYEYLEGNTLSITKGNTQEIVIGGKTIEEKYGPNVDETGYVKRRYYRSAGGKTEEKTWTKTGFLLSDTHTKTEGDDYEIKKTTSHNYGTEKNHTWHHGAETNHTWNVSSSANYTGKIDASADFSFHLGAASSFSFEAAAASSIGISLAAKVDISADAALSFEMSAGAGVGMKMEFKSNVITYNLNEGHFRWEGPKTDFQKKADLEAKKRDLLLEKCEAELKKKEVHITCVNVSLVQAKIMMNTAIVINT